MKKEPAVWLPTVRAGTGTDVFTEVLAKGLRENGLRAEITWLPLRAEYAPWSVKIPRPPDWANIAHVNTWLHPRFLPKHLPVVATLHHSIHHPDAVRYKGNLRSFYHRHWIEKIERANMGAANQVVAVSRFAADAAVATLLKSPMHVIHNGVDTSLFIPGVQRSGCRPFRLLYIGSWKLLKGVDLLEPIMRILGEDYELAFTGGLASMSEKRQLCPNMHDIGRLHDAKEVVLAMQQADALLFPSRSEGLPLSVLEAMACGLPVVAACGSSLKELVKHEETGLLAAMDDIQGFVDSIRKIASQSEMYSRFSVNSRKVAVEKFSVQKMLNKYIALYREVLK
ncbi:glycosyltransferase family 4 protein [Delftia sp. NA_296.1]|jgi:glycosyltransferase involved in cell wall biosynthesis|uniref:glycosyltransferase family 4 protein n=1 Tax=Delftia sp. NA_296.1 TaxID=3415648 RepID=UPI0040457BE8